MNKIRSYRAKAITGGMVTLNQDPLLLTLSLALTTLDNFTNRDAAIS